MAIPCNLKEYDFYDIDVGSLFYLHLALSIPERHVNMPYSSKIAYNELWASAILALTSSTYTELLVRRPYGAELIPN